MVMVLGSLRPVNSSPIHTTTNASPSNSSEKKSQYLTSRRTTVFGPSVLVASLLNFNPLSSSSPTSSHLALAQQQQLDELQQEEDRSVQLFQVYLADAKGNGFYREGKIGGVDPVYDLAILKVDAEGYELKPVALGTSQNLLVGQSCFAIGNPYGYENTLTTGANFCDVAFMHLISVKNYFENK